jgi:hypothetical protein
MKGALLLLVMAALLSLASARIELPRSVAAPPAAEAPAAPSTATAGPRATPTGPAVVQPAFVSLFRPATRPQETGAPQPGERFRLVGLVGQGPARIAFLRDEADGRATSARAGEEVAQWTLREVGERCVELRRGRNRQEVCM